MSIKRNKYIRSCEVSQTKIYNLGGYEQKVLFEGRYSDKPIVIYLHGGPGNPIPFGAGCRGLFPEITHKGIMVYWDQLGCGINNYVIDRSFDVETYVRMTIDLIRCVHEDFPENRINLFGVSWGSVLASRAATEIPELISKVMIWGQVTKGTFINEESLNAISSSELSNEDRITVERIKSNNTHPIEDILDTFALIKKYTSGYSNKNGGRPPIRKILFGILTSPDYTFKDFKAVLSNGTKDSNVIMSKIVDIDLTEVIKRIAIPYYIIQGETDIITPTKSVVNLLNDIGNESIKLTVLPGSGHMPGSKAMDFIIGEGFDFLGAR